METRHVRLSYEQALNAKKQLLSSELNLLHIIKRLKAYKALRKKETAVKNKLRTKLKIIRINTNLIQSTMPTQEPIEISNIKKKIQKEHKRNIQEELDDIKTKLARLR